MADPYKNNVTLALHFDGANNSTTFIDETGLTATVSGAKISTARAAPLTGNTASGFFDGSLTPKSSVVFTPGTALNNLLTGDYTIEGWIWIASAISWQSVIFAGDGGFHLEIASENLTFSANGLSPISFGYPSVQTWHHFEIDRTGGMTKVYIDGVWKGESVEVYTIDSASSTVRLGSYSATIGAFTGHLDDVRITKGVARHTVDFTPPAAPFAYADVVAPVTGALTVPLVITVQPAGSLRVPFDVSIGPKGVLTLPFAVATIPAAILSGVQSVALGSSADAAQWIPVVRLAGADVSAQVVGDIRVEAEAGAARIAELSVRPPAGTVLSLSGWTGLPVIIEIADNSTGTPRYPLRLFTGVINTPTLNQAARTIALRCTDDLQGRCQGMTNAALKAIIGGYESPAVFDAAAIGWSYAQDRLSTVAADLDISPEGALRLTAWAPKTTADLVLNDTLIGSESLAVQVAERAGLVNDILVEFSYRFPRVKVECHGVGFDTVTLSNFGQYLLDQKWFLQRAQCKTAIETAGGTVETISYTPLPTVVTPVGSGYFTPSAVDLELCMGFNATVSFDYAQTTEEKHRISVRNALSVATLGQRRETLSGALEGVYPDLLAIESGIRLFKAEISKTPPANLATPLFGETTSVTATLSPESDRAAANAAMEALIAIAKRRIWASHRENSVSTRVTLMPVIDVDKTIEINADGVLARGKVSRVTHTLSTDTGVALSEFSLALCALAGYGITHASDPTVAPSGTTATSTPLTGFATVVFNAGPTADHVLTITFPPVDSAQRDAAAIILPSTVNAPIVEDVFTVTL